METVNTAKSTGTNGLLDMVGESMSLSTRIENLSAGLIPAKDKGDPGESPPEAGDFLTRMSGRLADLNRTLRRAESNLEDFLGG